MAKRLKRERISQREYARRRGCSQASVWKAIQTGRISLADGKIDPELADRQWAANTDQSKPSNRVSSFAGEPKRKRAGGQPSKPTRPRGAGGKRSGSRGDKGDKGDGAPESYAEARAKREYYQARLAKLEYARRRGLLVLASEVQVGAFNMARKTRDQLIGIPERVSAILAATDDAAEVQRILDEEIERVCQELSGAERG